MTTSRGFISFGVALAIVIGIAALGGAGWWVAMVSKKDITASPLSGDAPLIVTFAVAATDSTPTNGIYYTIIFGDNEAAGFPRDPHLTLKHTYRSPGTYTAVVTRRTGCSSWECLGERMDIGTVDITVK